MLIFLYGPDSYRRMKKKQWYIREFIKKHGGFGVSEFDLSEAGAKEDLVFFLSHRSMFDPMRLAIAENYSDCDPEELQKILGFCADDRIVHVILSGEKAPIKRFEALSKKSTTLKFDFLKGAEWKHFAKGEAEEAGIKLESPALDYLARAYEGDSWRLVTELWKIRDFGKRVIRTSDLEEIGVEFLPDAWKLLQNLRSKNTSSRFTALELLFSMQEPPAKTFHILSSLWSEKISHVAAYDIAVKTGKLDYEEALIALVASV